MTPREFFDSLPPSSGSPNGMSVKAAIEKCSYFAARKMAGTLPTPVVELAPEFSGADRGTYFHALMDLRPQLSSQDQDLTEEQKEALRLYVAYLSNWGWPEDRFGCKRIGGEVLSDWQGNTIRLDNLFQVIDPLPLREFGALLQPGDYLIHDFKTSDSAKAPSYYLDGLQGRFYTPLWNASNPTIQCKGTLMDEVLAHVNIRKERKGRNGPSYHVYWAPGPLSQEDALATFNEWSISVDHKLKNPTKNLSACTDFYGKCCPLFSECNKGI